MPGQTTITRRCLLGTAATGAAVAALPIPSTAKPFAEQFPLRWRMETLANGIRVFIAPAPSQYLSAALRVRYGEINETDVEDGVAHLLEHVMAKGGAGPYSASAANDLRDAFPEENAETGLEALSFSAEFNPDQLDAFLDITARSLFEPRMEEPVIAQERMRVIEELSEWGNARQFRDMQRFDRALYGEDHPLSTFDPDREIETVRTVSRTRLLSFHERMARTNLVDLFLAGGVPEDAVRSAGRHLGRYRTPKGHGKRMPRVGRLARRAIIGPLPAPDLMKGRIQFKLGWNTDLHFGHADLGATILALKHLDAKLAETVSDTLGMVYDLGLTFKPSREAASVIIQGSTQAIPKKIVEAVISVIEMVRQQPMSGKRLERNKSRLRFLASARMQDNREVLKRLQRYADYGSSYFEAGIDGVTIETALAAARSHLPRRSDPYVVLLRKAV